MATYSASSFLASYQSTDKVIGFVDDNSRRTGGLNVCQFSKAAVEQDQLWVYVHDKLERKLQFNSPNEARVAYDQLISTVNTLRPNCTTVTSGAPPQTIESITLANYFTKQQSSQLTRLQWYDISDTGGVLGVGSTIRAQAKAVDDPFPSGVALDSDDLVTIDVLNNTVPRRETPEQEVVALSNSNNKFDSNSNKITSSTNSIVIAINSQKIEARHRSVVDVEECEAVVGDSGCDVKLKQAKNVTLNNVVEDLTTFDNYQLSDLFIDRSNTIGKQGRETMNDKNREKLFSYINNIDLYTPTLSSNIEKILDNAVKTANGEFRIYITNSLGNYKLTIRDTNSNSLAILTKALEGGVAIFRWDKSVQQYKFVTTDAREFKTTITVSSIGQSTFALVPEPTLPTKAELYVNGVRQTYGKSNDYYVIGNKLYWTNNSFQLRPTYQVIVKYN